MYSVYTPKPRKKTWKNIGIRSNTSFLTNICRGFWRMSWVKPINQRLSHRISHRPWHEVPGPWLVMTLPSTTAFASSKGSNRAKGMHRGCTKSLANSQYSNIYIYMIPSDFTSGGLEHFEVITGQQHVCRGNQLSACPVLPTRTHQLFELRCWIASGTAPCSCGCPKVG